MAHESKVAGVRCPREWGVSGGCGWVRLEVVAGVGVRECDEVGGGESGSDVASPFPFLK